MRPVTHLLTPRGRPSTMASTSGITSVGGAAGARRPRGRSRSALPGCSYTNRTPSAPPAAAAADVHTYRACASMRMGVCMGARAHACMCVRMGAGPLGAADPASTPTRRLANSSVAAAAAASPQPLQEAPPPAAVRWRSIARTPGQVWRPSVSATVAAAAASDGKGGAPRGAHESKVA
eukprot:364880-Chlamydomonas_euryale.AAC.2